MRCRYRQNSECLFFNIFENGGTIFENGGIVFENGGIIFENGGIVFENAAIIFENGDFFMQRSGDEFNRSPEPGVHIKPRWPPFWQKQYFSLIYKLQSKWQMIFPLQLVYFVNWRLDYVVPYWIIIHLFFQQL